MTKRPYKEACASKADSPARSRGGAFFDFQAAKAGGISFFQPLLSPPDVQRKCAACEEEERVQRKESTGEQQQAPPIVTDVLASDGNSLDGNTRSFMEKRFGYDFSSVKIHTDRISAKSAQSINALAYTSGNNIVFNEGQFAPNTESGKKLLAHELTHVVQQQSNTIQRTTRRGEDYAGRYEFDDQACTFNYNQDWFFSFPSSMVATSQTAYMTRTKNQVDNVWSHKHYLIPTSSGCPCSAPGVDVAVNLNALAEPRRGRHGYDVAVTSEHTEGLTTQPTRNITLRDTHDVPVTPVGMGGRTQQRIAHEFGHTLGITDEYNWWAALWNAFGHDDPTSIMHSGDDVRPRHYQHFADLISNEVEGCTYRPAGFGSRSLANPTARFGMTGALSLNNADFILELSIDRRLGNSDLRGMVTPRLGFSGLFNAANGNVMAGPTLSLSLNRLAHPIYVDVRTGVFFDPENPGRPASLNIPLSATAGLRGNGFSAGISYTGLVDVLGNNGYTHMIGLNLQFDLSR